VDLRVLRTLLISHIASLFPSELCIFGFNDKGEGGCFSINCDRLFSSTLGQITLLREFAGHNSTILQITENQSNTHILTNDSHGHITIWSAENLTVCKMFYFLIMPDLIFFKLRRIQTCPGSSNQAPTSDRGTAWLPNSNLGHPDFNRYRLIPFHRKCFPYMECAFNISFEV
jgi:hypothetical protein